MWQHSLSIRFLLRIILGLTKQNFQRSKGNMPLMYSISKLFFLCWTKIKFLINLTGSVNKVINTVKIVWRVYLIHTRARLKWDWLYELTIPADFTCMGLANYLHLFSRIFCRRCCRHNTKKINVMQQWKTRCCVPDQRLFHGVWSVDPYYWIANKKYTFWHCARLAYLKRLGQ